MKKFILIYLGIGVVWTAGFYFLADERKRADMRMFSGLLPFAVLLWPKSVVSTLFSK